MDEVKLTQELMDKLSEPFPPEAIQWKPGATNKDKSKGLALAYADPRWYIARLNDIVGAGWSDDYDVQDGGKVVLCHLTICGVPRADIGEASGGDENTATSALAQAFKRACVKFGLGAYLYRMPRVWVEYDEQRRRFTDAALKQLAGIAAQFAAPGAGVQLSYANGTPVEAKSAAIQAYHAYVDATGQKPASVEALRAWFTDQAAQNRPAKATKNGKGNGHETK